MNNEKNNTKLHENCRLSSYFTDNKGHIYRTCDSLAVTGTLISSDE